MNFWIKTYAHLKHEILKAEKKSSNAPNFTFNLLWNGAGGLNIKMTSDSNLNMNVSPKTREHCLFTYLPFNLT